MHWALVAYHEEDRKNENAVAQNLNAQSTAVPLVHELVVACVDNWDWPLEPKMIDRILEELARQL